VRSTSARSTEGARIIDGPANRAAGTGARRAVEVDGRFGRSYSVFILSVLLEHPLRSRPSHAEIVPTDDPLSSVGRTPTHGSDGTRRV
jgi:hypothetical protein